jgi:hypothetical protein
MLAHCKQRTQDLAQGAERLQQEIEAMALEVRSLCHLMFCKLQEDERNSWPLKTVSGLVKVGEILISLFLTPQ